MASPAIDRTRRVGGLIQRELSMLISTELGDPRVEGVTITDVKITRDLREATIYVSRLDEASLKMEVRPAQSERPRAKSARAKKKAEDEEHEYVGVLNRAAGVLRRHLGGRLSMRSTPSLHFRYDETLERGFRISRLIDDGLSDDAGEAASADANPDHTPDKDTDTQ